MVIGVLALQGSVVEHCLVIESQGDIVKLIKKPSDMANIDGLIIPGGESTTLSKLLKIKGLDKAIIEKAEKNLPIWGTCAGLILLGNDLGIIDIQIERNGYGSHSRSFTALISFLGTLAKVRFIRAPKISTVGRNVRILSVYEDSIVAAEHNQILVTCFHSEVSGNLDFYLYFKSKIANYG